MIWQNEEGHGLDIIQTFISIKQLEKDVSFKYKFIEAIVGKKSFKTCCFITMPLKIARHRVMIKQELFDVVLTKIQNGKLYIIVFKFHFQNI